MSRFITSLRLFAAGLVLLFVASKPAAAQEYYDDVYDGQGSYQQFYDDLSPYGEWVDDPQYGYVWIPDAGDDFRPYYSNGYWVNSTYGNTWVSNYRWGWAPFHYGRWTYSNFYGWMWIPGNVWGPAWVSWRSGGGCYGWAPMGPGVSINVSFGSGYYVPDYWWTFTPQQYILSPSFHNYCYGPRYNQRYVNQTTIINNTYVYNNNTYVTGPRRTELERATGRPVQQVAINNSPRPDRAVLRGNELSVYRPSIADARPNRMERPRNFSASRQPIAENRIVTRPSNMPSVDRTAPNQEQGMRGDRGFMRPDRNRDQVVQQPQRNPRFEQTSPAAPIDAQQQPRGVDRRMDRQQQAPMQQQAQRPREWSNGPTNRAPERAPMQQQQVPQQRVDRSPFDRGMDQRRMAEMQRPQMDQRMQRPMQQAPAPQQRVDRSPFDRGMDQQRMRSMERPQMNQQMQRPAPSVQERAPYQAPRMEQRQWQQQRMESPRSMPRQEMPARSERPVGGQDRGFNRR